MKTLIESQEEVENPKSSISIQENKVGLPDGPVDKNPPANAGDIESTLQCRGHWFDPWSRKIPHASGQLRPCSTTTEGHAF